MAEAVKVVTVLVVVIENSDLVDQQQQKDATRPAAAAVATPTARRSSYLCETGHERTEETPIRNTPDGKKRNRQQEQQQQPTTSPRSSTIPRSASRSSTRPGVTSISRLSILRLASSGDSISTTWSAIRGADGKANQSATTNSPIHCFWIARHLHPSPRGLAAVMDAGILWIYPVIIAKWICAFPRVTERVALYSGLSIRRKPRTRTHIWLRYLHLQHVLPLSTVFATVGALTCLSRRSLMIGQCPFQCASMVSTASVVEISTLHLSENERAMC